MEGRYANGILMVLTNCADPSVEAEFNDWYERIHIADILESGLFYAASRYQRLAPTDGDAKYLAIYETNRQDLANVLDERIGLTPKLRERGRMHPAIRLVRMSMFRRIGPDLIPGASRLVTGLLAVQTRCTDPTREEEFNDWYNRLHIPDMMATGRFQTGYRYQNIDPQAAEGKYLALYETDASDPAQASQDIPELFYAQWKEAGRWFERIEILWRATFRRIWPQ